MTARAFPATFGVDRDRPPVCSCARRRPDRVCDHVAGAPCGLPLCADCGVEDFGRDLCRPHARHVGAA